MKARVFVMMAAVAGSAFAAPCSMAGPNANSKILIHLAAPTTKNACTRSVAQPACNDIVTEGNLWPSTYLPTSW